MAAQAAIPNQLAGLEELYNAQHKAVYQAAYRVTGNAGDAEDVLQTVFLRLLRRESTEPIGSSTTYLRRAAINAALDVVRARQQRKLVDLDDAPIPDASLQPDRRQDARELRAFLRQAIARLSPKAAEIFALRYFEDYDNGEIARMLGLTANDVATSLHRSRGRLQEEIRSYRGESHGQH
jgi:RNA polymerase sigma-70 factor (ECF subfamily)